MVKQLFILALIFGAALGMPEKLSEKEFEEKFNELVDPSIEEKAGKELAKEEKEIEKQNEAFAKGEANFGKFLQKQEHLRRLSNRAFLICIFH